MSAPRTTNNGQIVPKADRSQQRTLSDLVKKMLPEIGRALPKHLTAERMTRIVLTALGTTRNLDVCSPSSFVGCIYSCAQLGLEPNTPLGHAYLIPRRAKAGGYQCTLIIGYQGMIDLSYRSGFLNGIDAAVVRQGDEFDWELGLSPKLSHRPALDPARETKQITHAYAVFHLKGGAHPFVVLSRAQIEARRKRSASATNGPWETDYEAMCLKTAVRAGWKWIPKSTEIARAIAIEEADEMGRSQLTAADPEIVGFLQAQGLEVEEDSVESIEAEGESMAERHPGEDG